MRTARWVARARLLRGEGRLPPPPTCTAPPTRARRPRARAKGHAAASPPQRPRAPAPAPARASPDKLPRTCCARPHLAACGSPSSGPPGDLCALHTAQCRSLTRCTARLPAFSPAHAHSKSSGLLLVHRWGVQLHDTIGRVAARMKPRVPPPPSSPHPRTAARARPRPPLFALRRQSAGRACPRPTAPRTARSSAARQRPGGLCGGAAGAVCDSPHFQNRRGIAAGDASRGAPPQPRLHNQAVRSSGAHPGR